MELRKCKICGWQITGNFCVNGRCQQSAPRVSIGASKVKYKTFTDFKAEVNKFVLAKVGMDYDDLPDVYNLMQAFEAGKTPEQAANAALKKILPF